MEWYEEGPDRSLIQGSDEWLAARRKRLGGSEIASVIGISPYKSAHELWLEKTGRVKPPKIGHLPHVKRGVDAEPVAREIVEKMGGFKYSTPTIIHPKHSFLAASLDGLGPDHIWECKTMGIEKHEDVANGLIPDYYHTQLQWNMAVTVACGYNTHKALFTTYRPEDGTHYHLWVKEDIAWQRGLLAAGIQFMRWVQRDIEPLQKEFSL